MTMSTDHMTERNRLWLALAAVLSIALAACESDSLPQMRVAGDPESGRLLLRQYGCIACHEISGVAGGKGNVGPPLDGIRNRVYLAGVLTNTPQNMARWIRAPQELAPGTAMPNLQVTEQHAQDMVAYLYRSKSP